LAAFWSLEHVQGPAVPEKSRVVHAAGVTLTVDPGGLILEVTAAPRGTP
jgi:hypothetical protein